MGANVMNQVTGQGCCVARLAKGATIRCAARLVSIGILPQRIAPDEC